MSCMTQRDPHEQAHTQRLDDAFLYSCKPLDQRGHFCDARGDVMHGWLHDLATRNLSPGVEPVIAMTGSREGRR